MARVIIVGGGISGLALAYRLQQRRPHVDITVLESCSRPGGVVHTDNDAGFIVEYGPNGFLDGKPSTWQLAQDLGVELVAASLAARKNRYLFLNNRIRPMPSGLGSFAVNGLLSAGGKLRMLAEAFVSRGRGGPESVAAFARRRFGKQAAEVFIDALVTGIHGGDPELLDVRSAFPRLARMEAEHGGVIRALLRAKPPASKQQMWSCPAGLGQIIDALTGKLQGRLLMNVHVQRLEKVARNWVVRGDGQDRWRADVVVLACPAAAQAAIVGDLDPDLAEEIAGIPYNRIAVVAVGFRAADIPRPYDGFGYIAPQRTRRDLLGLQWCSAIYPGRAPPGMVLWRALCGGWRRGDVVDWPDQQLVSTVRHDLFLAHGVTAAPVYVKIIRWPQAIPQYMLGHPERLGRIDRLVNRHPGLILAGNAYRGVALNDCTYEAARLADLIASTTDSPADSSYSANMD